MTVNVENLKQQYNIILARIIDLEEAKLSAGNSKYKMLAEQAKQLHQQIASVESVFDINSFEDSIKFFTQKGTRYTFLYGFDTGNGLYPHCKSENLRQNLILQQETTMF